MAVPTRITDISAIAANNSPTGSEAIGANLDNYLRGISAAFRGDLAYVGANIATAATPDLAAIQGLFHVLTGNTTVTGFVSSDAGIIKIIEALSTVPLIHSTTLPLIDSANMTLQPGEASGFIAKAGGVWKQLWVTRGSTVPAGSIMPYAGTSTPTGWLLCYGQEVSRSTYSTLFNAIGTTYGTGDGSSTFNLPDLRGRAVFGKDDMGGSAASRVTSAVSLVDGVTLGETGGDQRMHQHTHSVTDPGHNHDLGTSSTIQTGGGSAGYPNSGTAFSTSTDTTGITINNQGSGSSQNMPPAIILNYIIKA